LAAAYARESNGRVPSQQALTDALLALEGDAIAADPEPLALRVAEYAGGLLLDLGDATGRAVWITADQWQVVDTSPVLFRRTALTSPLPEPVGPGSLRPLTSRLNVAKADWPLLLGWLVACLLPGIPHPVLALLGEQGTGKSTAARLLVSVMDPSPAPLRTAPRDVDTWAVAASGSWLVALDNLSGMPAWLSDVLCRAVTGDGMVRRRLYTDDDLSVLSFRRVVVLNGIDLGALRGDLADRLLTVELERIDPTKRRTAAEVDLSDDERAQVLAAVLTMTVGVLKHLDHVTVDRLPRMADFARVLAALDQVMKGQTAALDRYLGQADSLAATVADADPFVTALRRHIETTGAWVGSPSNLLDTLRIPDPRPRTWPTSAQAVTAALMRAAPTLRQLGYTIDAVGRQAKTGRSLWAINPPEEDRDKPSPTSPSSPNWAA
jgi:hypothetical protein